MLNDQISDPITVQDASEAAGDSAILDAGLHSERALESPTPATATRPRRILCPYCGSVQRGGDQCIACKGYYEPLSRQATQNAMGPWQVRDEKNPFMPGCSYDKLKELVAKGRITKWTIIRGPSTRQFWSLASNTQGVSVLLGECHQCHGPLATDAYLCKSCGAVQVCSSDRQQLGLAPVRLLPGEAAAHEVAASASTRAVERPATPMSPAPAPSTALSAFDVPIPVGPGEGMGFAPHRGRRSRHRGNENVLIPAVFFVCVTVLILLFALTARRTPIDGAIRAVIGGEQPQPSPPPSGSNGTQANETE